MSITFLTDKDTVTIIDENADDKHVPTAKAVRDYVGQNGGSNTVSDEYDLKRGYAFTENIYITENGTETELTGQNYKCFTFIPVQVGVSYTMYGVGYALYDSEKQFLSAMVDEAGLNRIREFTPGTDGYVRLTINTEDTNRARFCKTEEKYRELREYEPNLSPFFDYTIPCDVHLYGDSNSAGHGLDDPAKAWSNRLGNLITTMPEKIGVSRYTCYAEGASNSPYAILQSTGYARLTAYTDTFYIDASGVGEIAVKIDGESVESITEDCYTDHKTYQLAEEGHHTIELYGVSGRNSVRAIYIRKSRSFTNHAVYGNTCLNLPKKPDGNIVIVLFGTNDRMLTHGFYHAVIWDFYMACKAEGVISYFFTPPPTAVSGEESQYYYQTIGDIIAQLPPGYIDIYKDLQLIDVLGGETIFSDNLHLTERGHKMLYAIAASKLQLGVLKSEII